MIRVTQVKAVRTRRRLRLPTPRRKEAVNAFHRLISGVGHVLGPPLQTRHFFLEPEKDDQGDDQGKSHDKKGQDDHRGAVGQLKGGVEPLYIRAIRARRITRKATIRLWISL